MRAIISLITVLAFVLVSYPTFAQSPAKTYKWMHPWFKKEITSPTPPTWPYRVISEKDGVVLVEVTPPGTEAPKVITPAPDQAISFAPQKQSPPTIPSDKEESCKKLAPFARAAADMRQKGISLQAAEAGTEVLFGKQTTPDGLEFAKSIVRTVYKNRLTTENAEEIFIASCKLMVFSSELEKNKK